MPSIMRHLCLPRGAGRTVPLAAIALGFALAASEVRAQAPRPGATRTLEGLIQGYTTAPMGERDGATLEDGTVIHWPPHLADRFSAVATKGDRVRAEGRMEKGPEGDTHFEVTSVTNLRTNRSVENDDAPPPHPPGGPGRRIGPPPPPPGTGPLGRRGPVPPNRGATRTLEGLVQSFTTAPMGEVDGATLEDGTVIHWPPHLADRFSNVVLRGDRIKVSGWMETGPEGDTHFEVQAATNLRTKANVVGDVPPGPGDFAPSSDSDGSVSRRLKAIEDEIAELRAELRRVLKDR